jgi:membrane-associated PAP2 superfamily phosphatase
MKSAFFLTLASLFASLATATQIDKELLCTEACWIYDNVNHDACKNGCINGPVCGLQKSPSSLVPFRGGLLMVKVEAYH